MKSLSEIKKILEDNKQRLFSKYSILSLAIFGSYARNEEKEDSDLDLIVEFKRNIGIEFIDLADEIEETLKMKIDLVSKKAIKENYFNAIQSDFIYV